MTVAVDSDGLVDDEIFSYLDLDCPRSFFLYAGAGSGKTRSLVKALNRLRAEKSRHLWLRSQRIGVITYTNAACDEIKRRLEFDPIIDVSTIHSFAWSLIGTYHADIRDWLRTNIASEIAELESLQARGRAGSKAAQDRPIQIRHKQQRLQNIEAVRRFVYSPTGDNLGRDSLNHSEVISMVSSFLTDKLTLQSVLVNKYPILFIDESQDTNRHLMDAFLAVQQNNEANFCLGLFGDTMQRIYADGKVGLAESIPASWARPVKNTNHRCPGNVIKLINRVRSAVDDHQQVGPPDNPDGFVRLFIAQSEAADKARIESAVASRMADITNDRLWGNDARDYKTLILEHHMAARRLGFEALFTPLYAVERFRTGLLDGTLPAMRFFAKDVLPLVEAMRRGDRFAAAALVRKRSPFLDAPALRSAGDEQLQRISQAKLASDALLHLWDEESEPRFLDVLWCVAKSGLFVIPEILRPIAERDQVPKASVEPVNRGEEEDEGLVAWDQVMITPFKQIALYDSYVNGRSSFDTHQGVKGLEFPRVLVIINDEEARGFLFQYEKLLGAKAKSDADLKNESQGSETTIDRTRRLLYVTCSRAEESLAIVAYSSDPEKVKTRVVADGWFQDDEVEVIA